MMMKKGLLYLFLFVLVTSCSGGTQNVDQLVGSDKLPEGFIPGDVSKYVVGRGTSGPYYDYDAWDASQSGRIETSIHYTLVYGDNNTAVATVDADEVLIGGGARITTDNNYGLLTGSYPLMDSRYVSVPGNSEEGTEAEYEYYGRSWVAQSRSHPSLPGNHYLWAFAIGMKLHNWDGTAISRDIVQKYVRYVSSTSDYVAHPSASVSCPTGPWAIIAGGAQVVDPFNRSSYLTASYRDGTSNGLYDRGGQWIASSKDHCISSPAQITSWAVVLKTLDGSDQTIPGFGDIRVRCFGLPSKETRSLGNSIVTSTGRANIRMTGAWKDGVYDTPSGYLLSGVGALTEYNNGWGRLLTGITPMVQSTPGVSITDQDHLFQDTGLLSGQLIVIQFDYNSDNG
jgi:hypothetical protein